MVIDATTVFSAKLFANTMQRSVGNDYKVQVEYDTTNENPWDWYDIEFKLFEKKTGKTHLIPNEVFDSESL